jgi:four helix bundle protein
LTSQIRRAAAAIPANIAEGHGRGTRKEYRQFLRTAQASLRELETHLILSTRVGLMPEATSNILLQTADRLGRMLNTLQQRLQSPPPKS